MKIKYLALSLLISATIYADTYVQRGSILSAEGMPLATIQKVGNTQTRVYPHGTLLAPAIGYVGKTSDNRFNGINGLEKFFNDELVPQTIETRYALFFTKSKIITRDIKLNIPMKLQVGVENITDVAKKELKADEIIVVVMDSKTGKVLSLASSERFDPSKTLNDHTYRNHVTQTSVEPGSAYNPIVFSILLDKGLIKPDELIDCHNGEYQLGLKSIVDERKFKLLSAEDVIVHSSYIGIAQLSQRLNGLEYVKGLKQFGFGRYSGTDLPYEKFGSVPSMKQMDNYLYKAIISYGYGVSANMMQMVKAYNAFNNDGKMVNPMIVHLFVNGGIEPTIVPIQKTERAISLATARTMKQILIKTVNEGTGIATKTPGLEIGGKTGSAHIAEDRKYVNSYRTSFYGFANDDKHSYTIGVMVIKPHTNYSASATAVPVFKMIVDEMVKQKYLKLRMPMRDKSK